MLIKSLKIRNLLSFGPDMFIPNLRRLSALKNLNSASMLMFFQSWHVSFEKRPIEPNLS